LLVDPATECGWKYIEFCCQRRGARDYWFPQSRLGISADDRSKAEETIRVCGLRAQGMLNKYVHWVEGAVTSRVELINNALQSGDGQKIRAEFENTQLALLNSAQRFVALSYDALVHYTAARLDPLGYSWPMPK